jgi:hypothetical protein
MPALWVLGLVPLVVFLALVALPRGRPALTGLAGAVGLAVAFTLAMMAMDAAAIGIALGILSGSAVALAAVAQALRHALGAGRPAWIYPLIIAATLIAGGVPVIQTLGL